MTEPIVSDDFRALEPVEGADDAANFWTRRLTLFLRVMAGISLIKGLYHWSALTGFGGGGQQPFELHSIEWQAATIFFAVIDLVAAVCLWLGAAWGAIVWLMSISSMLAMAIFFPDVFGFILLTGLIEGGLLVIYLWLALRAARESPIR